MHDTTKSLASLLLALLAAGCAANGAAPDDTAASMVRIGEHMQAGGEGPGAAAFYRGAAERDPRDPRPHARLGELYAASDALPQAEEAYRTALSLTPGDAGARTGLAAVLLRSGRAVEAEALLAPVSAGSRDARLLRHHGVALDMLGRPGDAAAIYRRGLAAAPTDPDLLANLALSTALNGQAEAAIPPARQAAGAPRATARHRRNLALVLLLAGRAAEARGMLPEPELEALSIRAERARAAGDAAGRAAAIGLVSASRPATE